MNQVTMPGCVAEPAGDHRRAGSPEIGRLRTQGEILHIAYYRVYSSIVYSSIVYSLLYSILDSILYRILYCI